MDQATYNAHLAAGQHYGYDSTCGSKVKYPHARAALNAAATMSQVYGRELEGYPCFWCQPNWHIGRKMSLEELAKFRTEPNS